jgi:glycosyltransferase involved in cell wall biosynthesis
MIKHGETGFFAQNDDDWVEYISELIENQEQRTQMGKKAYKSLSAQRFWTEQYAKDLYAILTKEFDIDEI